ncbi:unnamed protein product, partial [Mesorhabditis belari]|uniref:Uncharacterized protein n=1 Tax=Mesorhabditis belari TaxID=2138241 RepID=A0AAF3F813_9BILA
MSEEMQVPLSVDPTLQEASTSDEPREKMSFQYTWPLRICKRLVENEEALILNVSPPFTTSYNGVAFTWTARLSDECVVWGGGEIGPSKEHVFASLYYKDGIAQDVWVDEVKMAICDTNGQVLFSDLKIPEAEWTKGSGWPVQLERGRQAQFTDFVHSRVDEQIWIQVEIRMKTSIFNPMNYLPSVDKACRSQRIEECCQKYVQDFKKGVVFVPNMDLLNPESKEDKFAMHRLVFVHGCGIVEEQCAGDNDSAEMLRHIRSQFAHVYFKDVLMKEVNFYEDFVALLEGVIAAHLPALKREAEKFMCREVMTENADSMFIKRMLLLSERYRLDVLKMVATGVVADQIIAHQDPPQEFIQIKHELKSLASEISHCSSVDDDEDVDELLVGSVVEDLQSLTRRIRRVSLSHSPSQSSASSASSATATPTGVPSLSPGVAEQRPFDSPSTGRFKRVELDVG